MTDINSLMDDIANAAFESSVKIASLALISNPGKVLYQTKNWDLTAQANVLAGVVTGIDVYVVNGLQFSVTKRDASKIVATHAAGMGSIAIIPLPDVFLVSYVMPGADPAAAADFLLPYAPQLQGIK